MKTKANVTVGALAAITLPLFMAVGCAGNKQNLAQADAAQSEVQAEETMQKSSTQIAIATMDGYMAQLDQQQESVVEKLEIVETQIEAEPEEDRVEQISDELTDEEVLLQEAQIVAANEESAQVEEESVAPAPQQLVFYFDSNSDTPVTSDNDALLQHAQYLQQHPNMVLMISGHADSRGSKVYNQQLSEQRALNTASILLAAGVSGEQLRIDGLGDNVPMTDPGRWQENRRVEFTYMDSMMAQK